MLQFMIGSSGAGKSSAAFDRIICEAMECPDKTYLVIVPEQFTLQTQKELVLRHPNKGIMNIDVLSFLRLAFRVFEERGTKQGMVLEDMGKSLIVKKVLMEHKSELQYFAANVNRQGFAEEMKSVLSELLQYGIREEELDAMVQAAQAGKVPALSRKMHDIALIYRAFQEFLATRFITTEGVFDLLADEIAASEIVRDSVVVLDGFTGFTPSQYPLLRALLKYARKVCVTITMDREDAGRVIRQESYSNHRLFYTGYKTMETLRRLAGEAGCEVEEACLLPEGAERVPYRFRQAPALAHLEKHLFRFRYTPFADKPEALTLWNCATPKEEVLGTVFEIKRLVKNGLRYKDIAVVTGDVAGYGDLLMRYFDEAGIPGFEDCKRGILGNPLVELLRSLLELSEGDFSYEKIFRWIKCPLSGISDWDCDCIENYVLAYGIRGRSMWKKTWTRLPQKLRKNSSDDPAQQEAMERERNRQKEKLEKINAVRESVMETIEPVLNVLRDAETTTSDRIRALRGYLTENKTEDRLDWMIQKLKEDKAENRRNRMLVKEYEQIFRQVEDIFARVEELLADDCLPVKEFSEILETGFSEAKVGVVPPGRDQVVVGDIERTRLQDIKALFFLGVNEGIVPLNASAGGILSDSDREFFLNARIELAPTARQQIYTAEYYLYLNMTKPSQKLYVSYANKDAEGKELRASYLIGKLQGLFPKLEAENPMLQKDASAVLGADGGRSAMLTALREYREGESEFEQTELLRVMAEHAVDVEQMAEQVFFRPPSQQLDAEQVQKLYGDELRGSVTRLERYAQCAMGFFLEYGMKLEERELYRLSMPELGSMFHEALELFSKKLKEDGKQWAKLTDEEQERYTEEATEQAISAYKSEKLLEEDKRTEYMIDRVKKTVLRTVSTIREQLQNTLLVPELFEADFRYQAPGLDFHGKIDRVDLYEDAKNCYVKIMDYKSGNMQLDLNKVYHGLQMQLGLYLDAMITELEKEKPGKEIIPAAMLYYHVFNPLVERSGNSAAEIVKELRPDGLINRDEVVLKYLDSELLPAIGAAAYAKGSGLREKVNGKYLPVRTKQGGVLYDSDALVSKENFEHLRDYLKKRVEEFKEEIQAGNAKSNPYRYKKENACEYCKFKAICSFGGLCGKEERKIRELEAGVVWGEIGPKNNSK